MKQTCLIHDLYRATKLSKEEKEIFDFCTLEDFRFAINELNRAGLSSAQVQMLLERPFSRFGRQEYSGVVLFALALKKQATTVAKLHQALQDGEYWARIHGRSICFETETLPNIETINAYLGLK